MSQKILRVWTVIFMGITVIVVVVNKRKQRVFKYERHSLYVWQWPHTPDFWETIVVEVSQSHPLFSSDDGFLREHCTSVWKFNIKPSEKPPEKTSPKVLEVFWNVGVPITILYIVIFRKCSLCDFFSTFSSKNLYLCSQVETNLNTKQCRFKETSYSSAH